MICNYIAIQWFIERKMLIFSKTCDFLPFHLLDRLTFHIWWCLIIKYENFALFLRCFKLVIKILCLSILGFFDNVKLASSSKKLFSFKIRNASRDLNFGNKIFEVFSLFLITVPYLLKSTIVLHILYSFLVACWMLRTHAPGTNVDFSFHYTSNQLFLVKLFLKFPLLQLLQNMENLIISLL